MDQNEQIGAEKLMLSCQGQLLGQAFFVTDSGFSLGGGDYCVES